MIRRKRIHVQLTIKDKVIDWYDSLESKAGFFQQSVDSAYSEYCDREATTDHKDQ